MIKRYIAFIALAIVLPSGAHTPLLIIDTGGNHPYTYRNFTLLAESVGFKPNIKQAWNVNAHDIESYPAILLSLDGSFFIATSRELATKKKIENPLLQHIYQLINQLAQQKNKTIGLIIPQTNSFSIGMFTMMEQLIAKLGAFSGISLSNEEKSMIDRTLVHLIQSDASKSYRYHTALFIKKDNQPSDTDSRKNLAPIFDKKTGSLIATPLPFNTALLTQSHELKPVGPIGLYIQNPSQSNKFFIINQGIVHFADICEHFTLNPLSSALRERLLKAQHQLLAEVYMATHTDNISFIATQRTSLPFYITQQSIPTIKAQAYRERLKTITDKRFNWLLKNGIACGWMSIYPYDDKQEAVAQRILKSGLNMLWLQLNPEWFVSDNAIRDEIEKKQFFYRIRTLTAALKKKSHEMGIPVPRIFVGMEISGNFGVKPVQTAAKDAYDNEYDKIPSPLDTKYYWYPEVIKSFDRFYHAWKTDIGNGLSLAGIFLDFEMYHAPKQTGQFSSLMDFSDTAWRVYTKATKQPELKTLKTVNQRIENLLHRTQFDTYFAALQAKAERIGRKIKNHIETHLPGGMIAAYNITLPHTWFYRGVMAGLSSNNAPLIIATFNNDFYTHHEWLTRNNIHLIHMPVLLYSKLQQQEDFSLIDQLWRSHDGVWFNRYSRLEESRINTGDQWDFDLETSPLDTDTVIKFMNRHITRIQQELKHQLFL